MWVQDKKYSLTLCIGNNLSEENPWKHSPKVPAGVSTELPYMFREIFSNYLFF